MTNQRAITNKLDKTIELLEEQNRLIESNSSNNYILSVAIAFFAYVQVARELGWYDDPKGLKITATLILILAVFGKHLATIIRKANINNFNSFSINNLSCKARRAIEDMH